MNLSFISPRDKISEEFVKSFFPKDFDNQYLEVFLISNQVFAFESEISIFPGFIAISNLNPKNPIGVLIENPELYHTQKAIFDLACEFYYAIGTQKWKARYG